MSASVRPNIGLHVGSDLTVSMTFRSNGGRFTDLSGGIELSGGTIWQIVKQPPGAEQEGNFCGRAPAGSNRCGRAGGTLRGIHLRPHESKTLVWIVRAVEYRCPGIGDYWDEIFVGHHGALRKGPQSFQIFLMFENDPQEYVAQKRALGQTPAPFDKQPCDPHTVSSNG